jgi:hypothetical protein
VLLRWPGSAAGGDGCEVEEPGRFGQVEGLEQGSLSGCGRRALCDPAVVGGQGDQVAVSRHRMRHRWAGLVCSFSCPGIQSSSSGRWRPAKDQPVTKVRVQIPHRRPTATTNMSPGGQEIPRAPSPHRTRNRPNPTSHRHPEDPQSRGAVPNLQRRRLGPPSSWSSGEVTLQCAGAGSLTSRRYAPRAPS